MHKKKKFTRLSFEERVRIAALQSAGLSVRAIGRVLGRSPNTIAREVREKKIKGTYDPKKAQHKTYWRRYCSKRGCLKVALSRELSCFVREKLELGWSPERIAGYLRRQGTVVSKKAIYNWVYHRSLERLLFWKRHHKRSGRKRSHKKHSGDGRKRIDVRPPLAGSGHFEGDFIVCSHSSAALLVAVDRWTRETAIVWLPNRKRPAVQSAFEKIFAGKVVRSLTLDNDISFSNWRKLEETFKIEVFFTHPYHSWEKGLVENTNRWIRCDMPKKRDIATVTQEECDGIATFLNTVPRQCLGFKSAVEVSLMAEVS